MQSEKKRTFGSALRALPGRILRALLNNWPIKLLSLVLAVGLWGGLIIQDETLTREITFNTLNISAR